MIRETIRKLVEGRNLSFKEAGEAMGEIMSGVATDAQIGSFLTALRLKGETIDEITALASAMRDYCHKINPSVDGRLVDTCGTGGDTSETIPMVPGDHYFLIVPTDTNQEGGYGFDSGGAPRPAAATPCHPQSRVACP